MLNGVYVNPTKIYFGQDVLHSTLDNEYIEGSRILVLSGGASARNLGLIDLIEENFSKRGIYSVHVEGVVPNPRADLVYAGIELCRVNKINRILAVGGGSVIDTAKSIGIGCNYAGDFFDYYLKKLIPDKMTPVGTILTVVGSGSESSDGAVITKDGKKYSCGSLCMYPTFSILDPSYTVGVSKHQTACGIVDAVSHVLERYFTKTEHVATSDKLCEALIDVLLMQGEALLSDLNDYNLRAEIMWSAKLAHDNTIGFGRKSDWATHTIAHEFGARFDLPHGELLSVIFPAWMTFITKKDHSLLYNLGSRLFKITGMSSRDVALKAINSFKEAFVRFGMPRTLRECLPEGVEIDYWDIAMSCAKTTVSGTIGNFERLTTDDVVTIIKIAMEGCDCEC